MTIPSRRTFLTGLGAMTAASLLPGAAFAAYPASHRLRMQNIHTGDIFEEDMLVDGKIDAGALKAFRHFARDHRNGQQHAIAATTVLVACRVQQMMESRERLQLISGYRSPQSNALLRSRSSGVAKNSLHIVGRALDLRQPDRSVSQLHRAAMSVRGGGVGKYSRSNFVHVDNGQVRYWGS